MRKNFSILRVAEHWNRLPREVMGSPFLETFDTYLDEFLCTCSRRPCLGGGWTKWSPEDPSCPNNSVIFFFTVLCCSLTLTWCKGCCLNLFLAQPPPFSKRKWCWKTDHCRLILSVMCEWKKLNGHEWLTLVTQLCSQPAASKAWEGTKVLGCSGWSVSSAALGPAHLGEVLVPGGQSVAGGILGTESCQFLERAASLAWELRPSGLSGELIISEQLRCSAKCSKRLAWCSA